LSSHNIVLHKIVGDYKKSFKSILTQLNEVGIDIKGYPLSHIGMRTETVAEYEAFREQLKPLSHGWVENIHNGRPIGKFDLRKPLLLESCFEVSLIELMPPKPDKFYPTGIEHWGVVIGKELKKFAETYADILSGQQDQGPYCQPFFIKFPDEKRMKFYDIGLKDVVEKEGGIFRK
jgi:predicted metalloenzyme YecM